MAIGVFSVVGVMTALSAINQSIEGGLSFSGSQCVPDTARTCDSVWWSTGPNGVKRPRIQPRQAQEFKELMEAQGIPVTVIAQDGGERVKYRDKMTSPRIRGDRY